MPRARDRPHAVAADVLTRSVWNINIGSRVLSASLVDGLDLPLPLHAAHHHQLHTYLTTTIPLDVHHVDALVSTVTAR